MVPTKSLANLIPFSKDRQPTKRTPRGPSPTTELTKILKSRIKSLNPLNGKVEKISGAKIVAIKVFQKGVMDEDFAALKEMIDRMDGKVAQRLLNEMSGEVKLTISKSIDSARNRILAYAGNTN